MRFDGEAAMLIDVHTHAFPDAIAAKTIEALKAGIRRQQNREQEACADGTVGGLLRSMKENGVDRSIILPIATKPKQTDSILRFAQLINREGPNNLISFASFHPEQGDWKERLEQIQNAGFQGVKLHLEFQGVDVDAPRMISIFKEAEKRGLFILVHAGADIGLPPPVHCTPQKISHVLEYVSGSRIIAAHLGGWRMWDEVEKHLVGTPVYLDTAFVRGTIETEQYRRIILHHGADHVLFGSDSPWERPADTLEGLTALGLEPDALAQILYRNALGLFRWKE